MTLLPADVVEELSRTIDMTVWQIGVRKIDMEFKERIDECDRRLIGLVCIALRPLNRQSPIRQSPVTRSPIRESCNLQSAIRQ